MLKCSSAEKNPLLAVNRQTNIYPSSIERELIEKTTIIDRLDNSSFSQSVSIISQFHQGSDAKTLLSRLMPQLKYGLGFSHQDVNEKIRKVSGNKEETEPVIRTKPEGEVTDARQKFRKLGQSLLKRSNAAQPPSTDASSSDQSCSAGGNERTKVKSLSSEPSPATKRKPSSCGKGKRYGFLEIEIVKDFQNENRHLQNHVLINLTGLCQAIAAPAEEGVWRVRLVTNVYP